MMRQCDDYVSLSNRGIALQALNRLPEALRHFGMAIIAEPSRSVAYNNLGSLLEGIDQVEMAIPCYRRATRLSPDYAAAHANLGVVLLETGAIVDAYEEIMRAVELTPDRAHYYRTLAATGRITPTSPYFARMRELAEKSATLPMDEQIDLHFAIGMVYIDIGETEKAWPHLVAGNRLKRRQIVYDETAELARFDQIRTVFTAEFLADGQEEAVSSAVPIFVLGMPRSGTSLVEQILASHPRIAGAGEMRDLHRLADGLRIGGIPFPQSARKAPPDRLRQLAADYLAALRAHAPQADRIVDKLPANFQLIGLIRKALPRAYIIHVRRDPLDTCMSCFSRLFADGHLLFTYDLAELGRYYRAYQSLMSHWRQILPAGAMLEIDYEDLVADLPAQARRILDHCEMAWDEHCSAFHETRHVVKTASAMQVRRPLYGSSIGRWLSLRDALRPLTEALG